MLSDFLNNLEIVTELAKNFFDSPFMLAVKIFFGVYVAVLIIDIILLLKFRDIPSSLRVGLKGMDLPLKSPSEMNKRWNKVKERLNDSNPSQWKVAVLEADAIADEFLSGIGYSGNNMTERLMQIEPGQLDGLEQLKSAHQIRNSIVHDANYELDHQKAKETVEIYENFLSYLEFL